MTALPLFLQEQTEEAIRARMMERVPADVDKSEGSYIWDAIAPAAYEMYLAATWAQDVLRRGFASTTFGAYLDMRCEEHGVARRPAVRATGHVRFAGKPGTVVPARTRVATATDPIGGVVSIEYETTEEVALGSTGEAVAPVEAVVAGTAGNVAAGAIGIVTAGVGGVTGVVNDAALAGGAEAESDDALLARYLVKVRQPATSGNAAQYRLWALDVPGVGDAKVFPLWAGPGTVKVAIVDQTMRPASPTLVSAVEDWIDDVRPIGATVTVVSADGAAIDIGATVTLAAGYTLQAVKEAFEELLAAFFRETAFSQTYVSYARIGTLLLETPGVTDYAGLTVNGGTVNVSLDEDEVPLIGDISLGV